MNFVPFPSSFKRITFFGFFGVRNIKAVDGVLMFYLPKFDFFLFYLMERRESGFYNISQANWVVFG